MLDHYLHRQAKQDVRRKLSACFILSDQEHTQIKGYYTLSSNSIPLASVPESLRRKLPSSYTSLPATLLGRLAIAINFRDRGLGKLMLVDALRRSYELSKSIGSYAVIVDPIDDSAKAFYAKYGFITLPDSGKMFLPMKTIAHLF